MEKLTKEKYRNYLVEQIEKADKWRESCPLMNATDKIAFMVLKGMHMEKLYKLDNENGP